VGGQRRDPGEAGLARVPAVEASQVPAGDTLSVELTHGTGEAFIFKASPVVIPTVVMNCLYFKI